MAPARATAPARRDPVLRWTSLAHDASARYGIPVSVLLGLISVESGGNIAAVSPAGAFGLTQFMPGTAASYDVKRDDAASQIDGAARYLRDLGYGRDPRLALASYNAGPGNPSAAGDYPEKVLAAARRYSGGGARPTQKVVAHATSGGDDGNALSKHRSGAQRALLTVGLVIAGATLVYVGISRTAGIQHPIRTPLKTVAQVTPQARVARAATAKAARG